MTNKKTFMTASFEICNSDVFHFVLYFCSLVSGLSNVSLQTKWLLMKYFITFLHLTNGGLMRQLSSILLPSAFCKDGTWDGLKDWFFHWFSTIKHWRSQVWWLNLPGRNSGYGFQMRQWDHAKIHTGSGPDHPISISGISIWRNWDTIWFVSIPSLSLWVWTTW